MIKTAEALGKIRQIVGERGGDIQRYTSATEMALMRTLKTAMDPRGILNPGKILT